MTRQQVEYQVTETIKHGNCTIVIHRPVLDARARQQREQAVITALAQYGRAQQQLNNL